MKKLFFGLLVGAFLGLVSPYVLADSTLVGSFWNLVSYDGTGASGTLEITDTTLSSKFCNNVSQGYVFSGATIVASGAGMSTLMYCEGLPMTLETAFSFQQPATYLLSGTELTITTHEQHIFVFEKELPSICTLEYMPVCGNDGVTYGNLCQAGVAQIQVAYEGPCEPVTSTCTHMFDGCNICMRETGEAWACTKMYCETPTTPYCFPESLVGGDVDAYGCKGSAGYSRSQSQQQCVRVWEQTGVNTLALAYDFAYMYGMTTMQTVDEFRATDLITRQEAAKMLVSFAEGVYSKAVQSGATCPTTYTDASLFDPTLQIFIHAACVHNIMKGAQGAFFPHETLTKGQALAVLMRIADGRQEEPDTATWWMPYVTRATERKFITFDTLDAFNDPISRGDLITLAHTIFVTGVNQ